MNVDVQESPLHQWTSEGLWWECNCT